MRDLPPRLLLPIECSANSMLSAPSPPTTAPPGSRVQPPSNSHLSSICPTLRASSKIPLTHKPSLRYCLSSVTRAPGLIYIFIASNAPVSPKVLFIPHHLLQLVFQIAEWHGIFRYITVAYNKQKSQKLQDRRPDIEHNAGDQGRAPFSVNAAL